MVQEDNLTLYLANKSKAGWIADTSVGSIIHLNTTNTNDRQRIKFAQSRFDLDVMTILFKYRPSTAGFPWQLNTNFNAAEFIGFRTNYYVLPYDKSPLNRYQHTVNHFAYSLGGFVGIGATIMNPFVTNNNIQSEHEGTIHCLYQTT